MKKDLKANHRTNDIIHRIRKLYTHNLRFSAKNKAVCGATKGSIQSQLHQILQRGINMDGQSERGRAGADGTIFIMTNK